MTSVQDFQVRTKLAGTLPYEEEYDKEDEDILNKNPNSWFVPTSYYHVRAILGDPENFEAREYGPHVRARDRNGKFIQRPMQLDPLKLAVLYQFFMDMVNVSVLLLAVCTPS